MLLRGLGLVPTCLVAVPLLAACGRESLATSVDPSVGADDAVEWSGCANVLRGPRCVLAAEHSVRIWLATRQPVSFRALPSGLVGIEREPVSGGQRHRLQLASAATSVEVWSSNGTLLLDLPLLPPEPAPVLDRATALRAQGAFDAARRELDAAQAALTPAEQGRADALRARIALSEGRHEAAAEGLASSLALADEQGRISDAVRDATALAFVLVRNQRKYGEARSVLARATELAAEDPASSALLPHYRGVLALETGDLRRALAAFGDAIERTSRLHLRDHELLAREGYASTLATLGRHTEAVESQEHVVREFKSDNPCVQADRLEALAWFALQAEASPDSELGRKARRYSAQSSALFEHCKSAWSLRNHRINASLLAVSAGDLSGAAQLLEQLPPLANSDPLLEVWEHEAHGRLALAARANKVALRAFNRALVVAQQAQLWESQYLAWLGRARALRAMERTEPALRSYRRAQEVLGHAFAGIPLSQGQSGFQHAREAGSAELIELLVGLEQPSLAFEVARQAHARVIAAASSAARIQKLNDVQRRAWEDAVAHYRKQRDALERARAQLWTVPRNLYASHRIQVEGLQRGALAALDEAQARLHPLAAKDALPVLPSGELLLAYLPAGGGLRAFSLWQGRVRTARLDRVEPSSVGGPLAPAERARLGATMLEPFRSELSEASRIHVLTHADLSPLDIHALEVDGVPLLDRAPVSYTLDLAIESAGNVLPGALVVANPTSDLSATEAEADIVLARLAGERPACLRGRAASRDAVLSGLTGVDAFHYAGHARNAGLEGIDSHLALADGALSLGDILNLSRAPARVVLSACEGAASRAAGYSGGLGLAQAFIAAGSREVVAAARPVADALAGEFAERFYSELAARPNRGAAGAVQLSARALRLSATDAEFDWAAFRLITR